MPSSNTTNHSVILFDGVCNLCNKAVQFVIKRDKKDLFRFTSLQSETGQAYLKQFNLPTSELSSFVLIENDKAYTQSTGALIVAEKLTGVWPLLYCFIIIPPFIRNTIYNYIATHRYQWFGKQNECWLPSPTLKNKFL
jgi:predicted DCC family thiol-disulfide oxidoreductase YuxK